MENNKNNTTVPALKSGSGVGSGLEASSRNRIFAQNLKKRRNELGYSQQKISDLTGIGLKTIQNYGTGSNPKGDYSIALAEVLECSLDWLLMDKGPEPGPPGEEKQIDKPASLYNKVGSGIKMDVKMPEAAYGTSESLKDKLIYSQEKIITHLEKENIDLKARLEAIEKHLPAPPKDENTEKKVM